MGWGRIDDEFDEHPKVLAVLDENDVAEAALAIALWTLCLTWAHRNTRKRGKTPGLIPSGLPRRYFGGEARRGVDVLIKHRLWDVTDGGWLIHDFADYLPSEKTREERAAAGRKGAAARWHRQGNAEATAWHPDSNLPSENGSLPSSDGNGMASDGSRTPARRDPIPTPITHTQTQSSKAEDQTLFPLPAEDGATATPRKSAATRNADDPLFGEFYNAYPRKKEPTAARRAWDKAIRTTDPRVIIEAAQRLAAEGRDPQYTPYPASWLNAGGFADQPDPPGTALAVRSGEPATRGLDAKIGRHANLISRLREQEQ